ncbi:C-type lectin domain family 4 member A-like isoform X5 [Centroberyx affinis]|uniref:C-type lectin domain family 4 member A-like isoform X5 n=1 Tax=Centroberyx affinis TaxID=166261 RepID=UPI003A5BE340
MRYLPFFPHLSCFSKENILKQVRPQSVLVCPLHLDFTTRMNRKAQEPAVIFKNPHVSLSADKIEEEADYANTTGSIADQSPAISDESSPSHFQSSLLIAVCWVILVGIMAPRIYFTSVISEINAELRENQTENLQLKTEDNLTRAQWSLDAYCPKKVNSQERQCKACQKGWIHSPSLSSCYQIITHDSSGLKMWEEAREDCRGMNSDLVTIGSPEEQTFIYEHSWGHTNETSGYWIGLTDAAGSWKWVDESDVTEEYWIKQPAANAHCAISLRKTRPKGWNAVDCTERNRWICEMNSLSV